LAPPVAHRLSCGCDGRGEESETYVLVSRWTRRGWGGDRGVAGLIPTGRWPVTVAVVHYRGGQATGVGCGRLPVADRLTKAWLSRTQQFQRWPRGEWASVAHQLGRLSSRYGEI